VGYHERDNKRERVCVCVCMMRVDVRNLNLAAVLPLFHAQVCNFFRGLLRMEPLDPVFVPVPSDGSVVTEGSLHRAR
jgi:hypothetical protein